jgi:hypothetical protein
VFRSLDPVKSVFARSKPIKSVFASGISRVNERPLVPVKAIDFDRVGHSWFEGGLAKLISVGRIAV